MTKEEQQDALHAARYVNAFVDAWNAEGGPKLSEPMLAVVRASAARFGKLMGELDRAVPDVLPVIEQAAEEIGDREARKLRKITFTIQPPPQLMVRVSGTVEVPEGTTLDPVDLDDFEDTSDPDDFWPDESDCED